MSKDDLAHKNLDDASLAGSNLSDADLSHASLRRTRLTGANLQRATLAGADLHGARLDGADVTDADLRDADLTGASLHGVDLDRAATTTGIRLAGAQGLSDEVADDRDDQAESLHLARAAEDIVLLTQDIAAMARAALDQPSPAGATDAVAHRRAAVARIADLQARRNLVEDRILSLLEDQVEPHAAAADTHR